MQRNILARPLIPLIVLILLGSLTHFPRLSQPQEVVFDEVHFGKFVTAYCCTGERFFDIHPPHAKLMIAGVAWLGGYRGGFAFDHIGEPYGDLPITALRFMPALWGILLPLIIFSLLRQLGARPRIAFAGGVVVLLDNALVVQTRIIALDGLLLLATFGSLSAYLAAERRAGLPRLAWFIVAGLVAGLAVGTKFTGLAALALLGILVLQQLARSRSWRELCTWAGYGALIVVSCLSLYLAGWWLHFTLLPLPGTGDAFHVPDSVLPPQSPTLPNLIRETTELHRVMFTANYNLTASHPDASPWWSWPFMRTAVFYWQSTSSFAFIYFLGNPAVWWGGTILFFAALIYYIIRFGQRLGASTRAWIPLAGFLIAMLPLVRVPRALFLYHYLTPLIFSWLFAWLWLDERLKSQSVFYQRAVIISLVGVVVVGFLWFTPLTYGLYLPPAWHPALFWLPGWR